MFGLPKQSQPSKKRYELLRVLKITQWVVPILMAVIGISFALIENQRHVGDPAWPWPTWIGIIVLGVIGPVFSWLVALNYHVFHSALIFYLYYAFLLGLYLFSLIGIVEYVYPIKGTRLIYLVYLAALFIVHSAGVRFALSRALGDNWCQA